MASKHTNGRGSDGKTHLKPLVKPVYDDQKERPKVKSFADLFLNERSEVHKKKSRAMTARKFDKLAAKATSGRGSDGKTHLKPLVSPVYGKHQ